MQRRIDFSDEKAKIAFRNYINTMMMRKHLTYDDLASCCDIKTVHRYFKEAVVNMPKRLPEKRVINFLECVGSCYDEFDDFYNNFENIEDDCNPTSITLGDVKEEHTSEKNLVNTSYGNKYQVWKYTIIGMLSGATVFMLIQWLIINQQPPENREIINANFGEANNSIQDFHIVIPNDRRNCSPPFSEHYLRRLMLGEPLYSQECFAVRLTWQGQGKLYLFTEINHQLVKLHPNPCNALGYAGRSLMTYGQYTFPLGDNGAVSMFKLDNNIGLETVIALSVSENQISREQKESLINLPTICNTLQVKPVTKRGALNNTTIEILSTQNPEPWVEGKQWFRLTIHHKDISKN